MGGKLQNADHKSLAELQALGADKPELLNTDKIYSAKSAELLETTLTKNNFTSVVDPAVTDDSASNYEIGSRWTNSLSGSRFELIKATVGAAVWLQTGAGGGGLDIWLSENFASTKASDFTIGNDVIFKGTDGALGGDSTLDDNTVTPMNGERSILYTSDSTTPANSLNDYWYSEVIDTNLIQREQDSGVTLWVKSAIDAEVVIWDETNGVKLNSILDLTGTDSTNENRYSASFFIPSDCLQVRYGFHILTTPTAVSLELEFTNIEFSTNPFVYKDLIDSDTARLHTGNGFGSTNTMIRRLSNISFNDDGYAFGAIAASQQSPNGLFTVADSVTDGLSITIKRAGKYSFTYGDANNATAATGNFGLSLNSTELTTQLISINADDRLSTSTVHGSNANYTVASEKLDLIVGDIIRPHSSGAANLDNVDTRCSLTISGTATTEHVITPASNNRETFNAILDGTSSTIIKEDDLFISNGGSYVRNSIGNYTVDYSGLALSEIPVIQLTNGDSTGRFINITAISATQVSFGIWKDQDEAERAAVRIDAPLDIHFSLVKMGVDKPATQFLAAFPILKVATLWQHPTDYSTAVASSLSYKTINLDHIEGDSSFISIDLNQATIIKGLYRIAFPLGSWDGADWVSGLIHSITAAATIKEFPLVANGTAANDMSFSTIYYLMELSATTVIEFRSKASAIITSGERLQPIEITKLR